MSNLYSTNVMDNEVVKAEDLTRGYDSTIDNVKFMLQCLFNASKDIVIGGKIKATTGNDMSLSIEPVIGISVNGDERDIVLETEEKSNIVSIENGWTVDRIDTVEIYSESTESNEQQRAFIDFETNSKTLANVNVQKNYSLKINIVQNASGQAVSTAPVHTAGRIKVAEIYVPANANSLNQCIIYPITSDTNNEENSDWTNEKSCTYNIGTINDNKQAFRNKHLASGDHKSNVIGLTHLIVEGSNKISGAGLPSGGTVTASEESKTSSIFETLTFLAGKINNLYNSYLKNGEYGFKGEVVISEADEFDDTTALKLSSNGDGSANLKIGSKTIFTITTKGLIRVNSAYIAENDYDLITKKITDSLSTRITSNENAISTINQRIDEVNLNADKTVSRDRIILDGTTHEFVVATDKNYTLSGEQVIDGVSVTSGQKVIVRAQTDARENGLYQVANSGAWTRITDYNTPSKIKNIVFYVNKGTYAGKNLYCPQEKFNNPDEVQTQNAFTEDEIHFVEYMGSWGNIANRVVIRDKYGIVRGGKAPTNSSSASNIRNITDKSALANIALLADVLYPVGFVYAQYPGKKSPVDLGLYGTWTLLHYSGAFFRAHEGNSLGFQTEIIPIVSYDKTNKKVTVATSKVPSGVKVGDCIIVDGYGGWKSITAKTTSGSNTIFTLSGTWDTTVTGITFVQGDGLPNITGAIDNSNGSIAPLGYNLTSGSSSVTGAFKAESFSGALRTGEQSGSNAKKISFDASRVNSIYGQQSYVTPLNITVRLWERTS